MQQLHHSAYMPQQWPIPPLWNTNGNWYNNMAPPPEWHNVNMWRARNVQPQPQRSMITFPGNHTGLVAEAAAAAAGYGYGQLQALPDRSTGIPQRHAYVQIDPPADAVGTGA